MFPSSKFNTTEHRTNTDFQWCQRKSTWEDIEQGKLPVLSNLMYRNSKL